MTFLCNAISSFFFLLIRQPPTSTLFPYTTLFRFFSRSRRCPRQLYAGGARFGQRCTPCGNSIRDRKSTRLNSSHVSISYAVFCLKKKKTIIIKEGTPLLTLRSMESEQFLPVWRMDN